MRLPVSFCLLLACTTLFAQPKSADPFSEREIPPAKCHPEQLRLRALCPLPVSVVYYQQQDQRTLGQIRPVLEQIKALGFNGLKQFIINDPAAPKGYASQVSNLSLDVGLIPFYYGIGGWHPITDSLLHVLKMPCWQRPAACKPYRQTRVCRHGKRLGCGSALPGHP